ncbi:MAG TPA: phospholipid carrier-dependent glycosyltransferase [Anaerolineae bacterium]|jgi:4-amino-4-deoxy-L-arabinose transferase-like glycosyltransferase
MLKRRSPVLPVVFLWLIALIAAFATFDGLVKVRYHGDEGAYLNDSAWFDQWLAGDFASLRQVDDSKLLDPPVGPLMIGLSRRLAGLDLSVAYRWDYSQPGDQAINVSTAPTAAMLVSGRLPSALLSFGSIMLLAALVLRERGYLASTVVTIFIVLNQGLMTALRQVMTEAPLLFFGLLGTILCARGLMWLDRRTPSTRRAFWLLAGAGLAIGLSTASKVNGAVALAALAGLVLVSQIRHRRGIVNTIGLVVAPCATALVVFIALSPFMWTTPLDALRAVIDRRIELSATGQRLQPQNALLTPGARIDVAVWRLFTMDSALNCDPRAYGLVVMDTGTNTLNWERPAARAPLADGVLCASRPPWSEVVRPLTLLNIGLCLFGVAVVLAPQFRARRGVHPLTTLLTWWATLLLPIVFLSPLNWSRYYVLPVFFVTVFIGMGVASVVRDRLGKGHPTPHHS